MSRACIACVLALLAFTLTACEVISAPFPGATSAALPTPPSFSEQAATLPASVVLQRALAARAAADDSAAAADFSALLESQPNAPEAFQARYYLAESYASRGRWTSASALLRVVLATAAPTEPLRAPALFWLARAHEAAGDHEAAIAAYQQYRELATPLEPYAAMRQAAQEQALDQRDAAIANYLSAARSQIVLSERCGSFEKAIALLEAAGRPAEALDRYVELLALDLENLPYRVRLLSQAAALAQSLGQTERAQAWLHEIVVADPALPEAAAAAEQLLASGGGVITPAEAGRVYSSAERWADALAQFELALAAATEPAERSELERLRGLALRAQNDMPAALAALTAAAAASPNSAVGRQAQLALIQTVGQNGETERAIQGYVEFAATYPTDPLAPVALDRVSQLRERLGDTAGGLQARLDLGQRYPASNEGRTALHQVGLSLFTAERYVEARQAWQTLSDGNTGATRSRGAYWAARAARAAGDEPAARALFETARAAAPDSYEGTRAAEELGELTQGTVALGEPITAAQWAELRAWTTASTAAGTVLTNTAPLSLTIKRAVLLKQVGLNAEAIAEWQQAGRVSGTALSLVAVAQTAYEDGATYAALRLARTLLSQAEQRQQQENPPGTPLLQPVALRRLLFPTPYSELVRREAAAHNLDPRLLYALLRQESLFNPGATSWVGARGLAQVMPETGEGIAQSLGLSDFQPDDLYRPAVSIRFGAYYLGQRMNDLGGNVQGALAAYNGGLGNVQRWADGTTISDADLFSEQIDYAETRGYVRAVYGFWGVYQRLYAP